MLPLRTARLTLRMMRLTDAPSLATYRADPDVARYQQWDLPFTEIDALRLIDGQADLDGPTRGEWVQVALDRDGATIGDVGLYLDTDGHEASVGYTLSPAAQGKGYAAEAVGAVVEALFAAAGVRRIVANVDPANVASLRVVERLGFVVEGVARSAVHVRGDWVDGVCLALLESDHGAWQARPTGPPASVGLAELTEDNLHAVRALRTHRFQEAFVAPMEKSLAEALVPGDHDGVPVVPWFRAVVADGEIVGFAMLAEASEALPVPHLWRLLVDRAHQGRGIGRRALSLIAERVRADGHPRLSVSWIDGPGGPRQFYERLGFAPTGEVDHGETVAALDLR
jgi:RimJ/RimL family protein N-acetyltransferase